jgi:hypothetical protein
MNPQPVRQLASASRTRGLALAGAALTLLTMFCLQLAASNRAAWRSVLEPGPASVDQALAAICGSLALAIALWLVSAVLLSLLAVLGSGTSALGMAVARAARALAPSVLRNAIAALLGVAIATVPVAAQASTRHIASEPESTGSRGSHTFLADGLSPAWAPAGGSDAAATGAGPSAPGTPAWRVASRSAVPDSFASEPVASGVGTAGAATPNPVPPSPSPYASGPVVGPKSLAKQATGRAVAAQTGSPRPDLLPGWIPDRPPQPEQSDSGPTHSDQTHSGPTQFGQTHSGPTQFSPTQSGPTQFSPTQFSPTQSIPIRSDPARSDPARSDLTRSDPARPEPTRSDPARPGPTRSDPARPGQADAARRARPDQSDEIIVRRGDTLWGVAEHHLGTAATNAQIAREWPHWFAANRSVIGNDPDHLVPGERLRPPEREGHRDSHAARPDSRTGRHRVGAHTGTNTEDRPGTKQSTKTIPRSDLRANAKIRGGR